MGRWVDFLENNDAPNISDINLTLVEKYRAEQKEHVAPGTLHQECTLLKQLANFACDRDFLLIFEWSFKDQ